MTNRLRLFTLLSAMLLVLGNGAAFGTDCTVCERNLVNCRTPAQSKFVACMNAEKSSCSSKCASDCRSQKDSQRCTIDCVRTCSGVGNCRATFTSVTNQCGTTYQNCKKDCTIPR